jgi:hypothetical protein
MLIGHDVVSHMSSTSALHTTAGSTGFSVTLIVGVDFFGRNLRRSGWVGGWVA